MKIEIPKNNRMSMTGRSIMNALQNRSMATIDLLIRESIQNSLDACIPNLEYKKVVVNFNTGLFSSRQLNQELDALGKQLQLKYKDDYYDFISIEDKNTVGLNGEISTRNINGEYGNFQKLVYEIAKPQTQDDAGGSWGYGKTVYFRIGIGLVVFYTRYKDSMGRFKERLACTYIEDETSCNSLLKKIQPDDNRGIAWFGKWANDGLSTVPIEDEEYIHKFLSIFSLNNYSGAETGTKIIIPYIDKNSLLLDLRNKKDLDQNIHYNWENNFEESLANSIMMWYAPRLNNSVYVEEHNKPFLTAYINNKRVSFNEDNNIFFNIINILYKQCLRNNSLGNTVELTYHNEEGIEGFDNVHIKNIKYSRLSSKAGTVAFTKISKELLKSEYEPYVYIGKDNYSENGNRPIICFCRKPGMIIDYHLSNEWADTIPSTEEDEFLIGIFVLNSDAMIDNHYSLETYVRETEMADHTSWKDITNDNIISGKIISTICKNTKNVIKNTYIDTEQEKTTKRIIGISQKLGKIFLPSTGFGNKPQTGIKPRTPVNDKPVKSKNAKLHVSSPYDFTNESVKVDFILNINSTTVSIEPLIITETGGRDRAYWLDNMGQIFPLEFSNLCINEIYKGKSKKNLLDEPIHIKKNTTIGKLNILLHASNNNYFEEMSFIANEEVAFTIKASLEVYTFDRNFSFSLKMKKED